METKGPRAFCAREQVLAYHSNRIRTRGKITPARELLFATGHFQHDFVVQKLLRNSEYAGDVYARWRCRDFYSEGQHIEIVDTLDNVINKRCDCGLPLDQYNEIDLYLPNLMLVGHPDLVFLWRNKYFVREFKTMDRTDVDFDDLATPLASHRLQVSFYYKMLKVKALAEGREVSRRLVVDYVDRSNKKLFGGNPYKPLAIPPEKDEYLTPFKNRLLHAVEGIKSRKLPPRICPSISCTRARNCDLAVECFERRGSHVKSSAPAQSANCLIGDEESGSENKVHNRRRLRLKKHGRLNP